MRPAAPRLRRPEERFAELRGGFETAGVLLQTGCDRTGVHGIGQDAVRGPPAGELHRKQNRGRFGLAVSPRGRTGGSESGGRRTRPARKGARRSSATPRGRRWLRSARVAVSW